MVQLWCISLDNYDMTSQWNRKLIGPTVYMQFRGPKTYCKNLRTLELSHATIWPARLFMNYTVVKLIANGNFVCMWCLFQLCTDAKFVAETRQYKIRMKKMTKLVIMISAVILGISSFMVSCSILACLIDGRLYYIITVCN